MNKFWKWLENFARDQQGIVEERPAPWPAPAASGQLAEEAPVLAPNKRRKPAMERYNWDIKE